MEHPIHSYEVTKTRGRLWLTYFNNALNEMQYPERKKWSDPKWTDFMSKVMDEVAEKMNCFAARRRPEKQAESGEYLGIDVFFIGNEEYDLKSESAQTYASLYDPFVLPYAVLELENSYDTQKISYCLWKILCVRAPIRVLVCYQADQDKVVSLKERLENVIWEGSLMKGTHGDILVIIGDESVGEQARWEDYFCVFEWRNDALKKIEGT